MLVVKSMEKYKTVPKFDNHYPPKPKLHTLNYSCICRTLYPTLGLRQSFPLETLHNKLLTDGTYFSTSLLKI